MSWYGFSVWQPGCRCDSPLPLTQTSLCLRSGQPSIELPASMLNAGLSNYDYFLMRRREQSCSMAECLCMSAEKMQTRVSFRRCMPCSATWRTQGASRWPGRTTRRSMQTSMTLATRTWKRMQVGLSQCPIHGMVIQRTKPSLQASISVSFCASKATTLWCVSCCLRMCNVPIRLGMEWRVAAFEVFAETLMQQKFVRQVSICVLLIVGRWEGAGIGKQFGCRAANGGGRL